MSSLPRRIDDRLWRCLVLRHSFAPMLGIAAFWALHAVEAIYFHDKCSFGRQGYKVLEGTIVVTSPEQYRVMLDEVIEPQSQSGSPVISQTTGKVVGIVAAAGEEGVTAMFASGNRKTPHLLLTPACGILHALQEGRDFPLLRDVIGKKPGGNSSPKGEKRK